MSFVKAGEEYNNKIRIDFFSCLLVALVNSQIVLKGIESEGCVLVAAGNTIILNRLHTPVWSKGELFNKKTWVGNVENLQVTMMYPLIPVRP